MATPKSPFIVVENFLSPKVCEQIVDNLGFYTPDYTPEGDPLLMSRTDDRCEEIVYKQFTPLLTGIEKHYDYNHKGTERMQFEFRVDGVESDPHCENCKYINKKWTRVYNRDFTCVLFLSDYNDKPPFDSDFEVYGGKLEFPQHQFGFNPQRGTLIIFPSGPHFINANAEILAGELVQVRFHLAGKLPYLYQPENFPGDYRNWF